MNNLTLILRFRDVSCRISTRVVSTSSGQNDGKRRSGHSPPSATNFSRLQGILSKMKVGRESLLFSKISKYGNSDLFNYATNKKFDRKGLQAQHLETWERISKYNTEHSCIQIPWNGFQELIMLTEQGRLWKFPIDNEIGMEEKDVPFEDHVFLDEYLKDFPDNEYIQTFMGFVVSGLANNHWMTANRKREIISFYKDYFEEKRDTYKAVGFNM